LKTHRSAVFAAILSTMTAGAQAQQAESPAPDTAEPSGPRSLDRVSITASRRLTTTQEIPYSVQAIDGATIREKNIQQFEDYVGTVLGVGFGNRGDGRNDVFLRGISSPGVGRSAVGFYIDEIPLAFSGFQPDSNTYDMARIEVLKGPQGTLYGEGALGGAFKLITNKPRLDRFDATAQATLSAPKDGRLGGSASAMLNLPLVTDRAGLRVVVTRKSEGGWIDNLRTGASDVNRGTTTSARAQLALAPSPNFDVLLTYLGLRGRAESQTYADYGASSLITQNRPFAEPSEQRADTYNLTTNWALPSGTLTFSASRSERDLEELQWAALSSQQIGDALGIPDFELELSTRSKFNIASQELRFVSEGDSTWRYVVGAFHKTREQPFKAVVPNPEVTAGVLPDPLYDNTVLDQDRETALFGEISYDIKPHLHATAGLRVAQETNTVQSDLFIFYAGQIPTQSGEATHRSVSPRLALSYDVSKSQTLYGTVGKGYRAGGANFQIDPTQGDPLTYKPDSAINFETGHKATWLGGTFATEIALYHMRWRDVQVFTNSPDGARSYTFNGGEAASTGLEMELRARPARGVDLGLGLSLMDATYKTDIPEIGVQSGTDLPFAPEVQGFASLGYRTALSAGLEGAMLAEVQHIGRRLDSVREPLDAFTTFDLRFSLRRDKIDLTLFARNLFNAAATLDTVKSLGAQIPTRPRTVGITASIAY
jgi:iron complex outermembrane receptor protein